jgi:membrane associated rhomboid family serine protease
MNNRPAFRQASMPCPNCGKLIGANAKRCIHCGLPRPRWFVTFPMLDDLILDRLRFTNPILLACFVLYALSLVLDLSGIRLAGGLLSILSPSNQALYRVGMGGAVPMASGRWWTLLTANYLHGGILHILFNVLWLRQIGPLVEELYGSSRFIIIYTLAGVLGSLTSVLAGTFFFIGASGAIFGLFGALLYYGRSRGGTFGSTIFRQLLFWAVIAFAIGLFLPGVDNWGHLGGLVVGLAAGWLLSYQERGRQKLVHHLLAFITILFIGVCFAMMVIYFFIG